MAKDSQIAFPDEPIMIEEMINLVPDPKERSALFHSFSHWETVDDQGAMVFFHRAELLLRLGTKVPFCRENAGYINFIMKLARFSADMFEMWARTDAIPKLSKDIEALQEDLDCLLRLIPKNVPREFAEPLLEEWKRERRHS